MTQQEEDLKVSNQQLQQKIHELQQVEESLRSSEEKFRQLAENIQDVFWIGAPNASEIIYVSPAYEKIWGSSCESLYTNPNSWFDIIHPEDRERVSANLKQNTCEAYEHEYRIIKSDGSVHWIWNQTFPICNAKGKVYRWVGLAQDISDRKFAEATRKALEQERELSELKSRWLYWDSEELSKKSLQQGI